MKDNIIEFLYPKKAKEFLEEIFPVRAVQNIPDWFKNIKEHNHKKRTIKGCVPFLDAFTAGYILKMPSDFYINHNYTNKDKKDTAWSFPIKHGDILKELKLNINNNDANRPSASACQYVITVNPNRVGMIQFHNHLTTKGLTKNVTTAPTTLAPASCCSFSVI